MTIITGGSILFRIVALSFALFPALLTAQESLFLTRTYRAASGLVLPYRLFVPAGYSRTKSYPLILALHGAGAKGTDNKAQLTQSRIATVWAVDSNQAKHPAFIFAPQCPVESTWVNKGRPIDSGSLRGMSRIVLDLMDSLARAYPIDPDRLYILGQSMGGHATWEIIERFTARFAAAIPMCGIGDPVQAPVLIHLPIWAFHGDKDATVPVEYDRTMIAAIRKAGGSPRYTEYPGVDHEVQVPAMNEPGLPAWLYAQKRPVDPVFLSAPKGPAPILRNLGTGMGIMPDGKEASTRSPSTPVYQRP
ncbi:MAG: hypothetical protein JWP91_1735 [Fibrobacteres bacterium]|nr:hypothetical protein [Fibrobacterota bacterium]